MARRPVDLPDKLPLFPLEGALLLPRTRLPLHIFEPRYLQMLDDCLRSDHRLIGVIQPAGAELAPVGCAGRVKSFTEMDDGRYMIALHAVSRFRLRAAEEGFTPYLTGQPDWSGFQRDLGRPEQVELNRDAFLTRLTRFMEARELSTDMDAARDAEPEMLINSLAMLLPFTPSEKQALLEAATLPRRLQLLDGLMEYALHSDGTEERLQ